MHRVWLLCVLLCAGVVRVSAGVTTTPLSNDPEPDQEPAIVATSVGGQTRITTAWMTYYKTTSPRRVMLRVSSSVAGGAWSAPRQIERFPNGIAGDPMLAANPANPAEVYLVSEARQAIQRTKGVSDDFGGTNEIALWKSTDGGASFCTTDSCVEAVCRTTVADTDINGPQWKPDKPSITIAADGTIYVAHMHFDVGRGSGLPNEIHVHRKQGGSWSFVQVPLSEGESAHSPIVLTNPGHTRVYVAWLRRSTNEIAVAVAFADPAAWPASGSPSPFAAANVTKLAAGSLIQPGDRLTTSNCAPGAASMLMARYNAQSNTIGLVWHAKETAGTRVNFASYAAGATTPAFATPQRISIGGEAEANSHRWNPAIDADASGNYLITYYDTAGTTSAGQYHFRAAYVQSNGQPVPGAPVTIDPMESDVRRYEIRTVGEYQDVRHFGGRWFAGFIGVRDDGSCDVGCGQACKFVRGDAYAAEVFPTTGPACAALIGIDSPRTVSPAGDVMSAAVSTTPLNCTTWTSTSSDVTWARIEQEQRTGGSGTFQIRFDPNPSLASRTATIIVHNAAGGEIARKTITQGGQSCDANRSFYVTAGRCLQTTTPVYSVPRNTLVIISPEIVALDGTVLLGKDEQGTMNAFEFEWTGPGVNGNRNRSVGVLADVPKTLTVKVKRLLDNTCHTISISIEPTDPACATFGCDMAPCKKRRAVRHNNLATQSLSFTPGQTFVLQPPDDVPAVSYQWHRAVSSTADEVFATTANVSVTPYDDTQYWVVVNYGTEVEESDLLYAVNESPSKDPTVTPKLLVLPAGSQAQFDVVLPAGFTAIGYEWRMGDPTDPNATIVGTGPRLTRSNVQYDASYWCVVTKSDGVKYPTNVAQLVVTCTSSIGGQLRAEPNQGYVSKTDRPYVWTSIVGKQLSFRWYWRLPGSPPTTPQLFQTYGSSTWVSPTQKVTEYMAHVTDACGNTADLAWTPVYLCVPTIDRQPISKLVQPNDSATLDIIASPAAGQELTIKWYAASDPYEQTPLKIGASFQTPPIPAGTTQTYYATVSADCSGTSRGVRSVFVDARACTKPTIAASTPSPAYVRAGSPISLSVTANGTALTYQWYTGTTGNTSSPIAGATNSFVTVSPTATTTYWVRVSSESVCYVDSPSIVVDVCTDPVITTQPVSVTIRSGSSTTLSVASSTSGVTYQWYNVATADPIAGATSPTLTVSPTVDTQYYARIKRNACTVQSSTAKVTVCALTANLTGGKNTTYQEWVTLTVTPSSARVPAANAHYTWYKGTGASATVFNSGTGMTQRADNPATTTQYWVRVNDGTCTYDSNVVTVNVCIPTITAQPQGTLIQPNQTATLSVGTTNIVGQTFRWYIGTPGNTSQPAPGTSATSSTYITPALTATTSYWVRVTGPCGNTADSNVAVVNVCAPATISSVTPTRYIKAGTQTTIQVYATGSNPTYQWYIGSPGNTSNPIAGATADYAVVAPTTTTTYWARVWTDGLCTKDSPAILVDVCTNPVITTQPAPVTIRSGSSATLSVATSTMGVTYQWYNANTADPIPGATNPTLTVTPAADTDYYVRITRNACTVQSNTVKVTVCTLTASLSGGRSTAAGDWVTLTANPSNARVAASSAHYTWYRGTGASATVFNSGTGMTQRAVNPATTTEYWVRVNDGTCSYDSNVVTVNVCIPTITAQPQGSSITRGQSALLSVSATGAPLTYQWYIGAPGDTTQPVAGGTASTLTVSPLTTTSYWVRVTGCTAVDSAPATIDVCQPAAITGGPYENGIRVPGAYATVWVTATGTGLTYQWYLGQSGDTSIPLSAATGESYQFQAQDSRYYWVRVTGACGAAVNSAAVLHSVNPRITQQPVNTTVPPNGTATLSVTATGTYLGYQWYRFNSGDVSNPIAGATSPTFTTPPITAATNYWCRVTSAQTFVNTNHATVGLCTGPSVTRFRAQYNYSNYWWLSVTVADQDLGNVHYHWYTGVPGNVAQSVYKGEGNGYRNVLATTQETWWVRVWYANGSCYTDTYGQTIYPMQ